MVLDTGQSIAMIVGGLLMVVLLLRILMIVHGQAGKVKELEKRMKMMEEAKTDGKESIL